MQRAAIIALAALALTGCHETATGDAPKEPVVVQDFGLANSVEAFTDPLTGCEYLIYRGSKKGGITARLNRDGLPVCGRAIL